MSVTSSAVGAPASLGAAGYQTAADVDTADSYAGYGGFEEGATSSSWADTSGYGGAGGYGGDVNGAAGGVGVYDVGSYQEAASQAAGRGGTALYAFTAEMDNEVSIEPGDRMEIEAEAGEGWVQVRLADGRSGLVPADYIQLE